jgi:glutathione S-transferase
MKLYWGSGSPYSWRAMLGLVLKGIDFESKQIQFSKGEHRAPEFLALNPRGKVPVLVDGDTVVYESLAILAYLERKRPEPALFGESPAEHGLVWRTIFEHDNHLAPVGNRFGGPALFGRLDEKKEQVVEAAPELHAELGRIEDRLSSAPFLVGPRLSAADVVHYVSTQVLLRSLSKPGMAELDTGFGDFEGRYPRIATWKASIDALPGVDSTYPPHWRA